VRALGLLAAVCVSALLLTLAIDLFRKRGTLDPSELTGAEGMIWIPLAATVPLAFAAALVLAGR